MTIRTLTFMYKVYMVFSIISIYLTIYIIYIVKMGVSKVGLTLPF